MMKERFVDGLDPDYGLSFTFKRVLTDYLDYSQVDDNQFDPEEDRKRTDDWFDSDDAEPDQRDDDESEDEYMKMDLTKL